MPKVPSQYSEITFAEQLFLLDEIISWINSLGIETNGTRIEKIRAILEQIVSSYEANDYGEIFNHYSEAEVFYSLTDVTAYFKAYEILKELGSHEIPRRKIRQIIDGPLLPVDESPVTGNAEGRNILFEQEVAWTIKDRGYDINDFDDVHFNHQGTEINVQCKRVHSERNVQHNVERAVSQFLRRAAGNSSMKGIIAIAIEKITDTEDYIFECYAQQQINAELDRITNSFIREYSEQWDSLCDLGIVGVLVFVKFIAKLNLLPAPKLIVARKSGYYRTCGEQSPVPI